MKIRPYRSDDAAAVSHLIRTTMAISNSADYGMERLQPLIDYFSPERVEALSEVRDCLVAEDAGEIVGTGALEGSELVTFFVDSSRQGEGIGSALIEALEGIARRRGITALRVGASYAGAPFYESRGYRRTGELLEGIAGPHVGMIKPLGTIRSQAPPPATPG